MKKVFLFISLMVVFSFSCASYSKLTTPSGKPEIFISNMTQKEVFTTILNDMMSKEYSIEHLDEYSSLSFTKNIEDVAGYLFGGGYATEKAQVRFNLISQDNGVKVYASTHQTHRGRYLDHSKYGNKLQNYLEELKVKLEK